MKAWSALPSPLGVIVAEVRPKTKGIVDTDTPVKALGGSTVSPK